MLGSMISQKQTDVSEMLTASIIRVILMMDAVRTSATSEYFYEARRHNIPEGSHLHTCHHENPKFNFIFNVCDVQWNSFKKTPLKTFSQIRHHNYFVPKFHHMINIGFALLIHFLFKRTSHLRSKKIIYTTSFNTFSA
jgi:hypothetical protein